MVNQLREQYTFIKVAQNIPEIQGIILRKFNPFRNNTQTIEKHSISTVRRNISTKVFSKPEDRGKKFRIKNTENIFEDKRKAMVGVAKERNFLEKTFKV